MDLETQLIALKELQEAIRPANTPRSVSYPLGELSVPGHVAHWARERPDKTALVFAGREYSFSELDELSGRLAGWLADFGIKGGDRVAVYLGNCPEFIIGFLAILRLGAVHVPVNPMFQPAELAYEIVDSDPRLIITDQLHRPIVDSTRDRIGELPVLLTDAGQLGQHEYDLAEALTHRVLPTIADDMDALAALNYTGGTTGLPKGCQHSQRDMLYTTMSGSGAAAVTNDGTFVGLCYFPIFWIAGEDLGILFPLILGGTVVLMPRWDADEALEAIETYRVTTIVGTVENYLELINHPAIDSADLSSLLDPQAVSFVRKLTPDVRAAWSKVAPGSTLRESSYGMTETHTIDCVPYGFAADDQDLLAEPVFCGVPVPETDISVVAFGSLKPMPLGEVGEIIVRSPSVTSGYWRNPEATDSQLVNGWLRTGDSGRFDELGCLHYLGRQKEMIKVKGMSVFPAEVELLLSQHPAVESVAVVPADDPRTGQRPVAFVVRRADHDETSEEIVAWAAKNMATYKVPLIHVVNEFPMTATGKVKKHELTQTAQAVVDSASEPRQPSS